MSDQSIIFYSFIRKLNSWTMNIENNINNQTTISTPIIYSSPNTNIKLYGSSSTTSNILLYSKTVLQNDITTTLLPSSSISGETSSLFDTSVNSHAYISPNPISTFTSQQSSLVPNIDVISSTISSEIHSPIISNIQSIQSSFSQQGYSFPTTATSKCSPEISTSHSPVVSAISSDNSINLGMPSSSIIPITTSSSTFPIYSQDQSTSIPNSVSIKTVIPSSLTHYDTTSRVQQQSRFSSSLQNPLWPLSEVSIASHSTTFHSITSSTSKSNTTIASPKDLLTYTPSFTQHSMTSQYFSYPSHISQSTSTNKTLIKSFKNTTATYLLGKTPTLKSIKETSSSFSFSSKSSLTTTDTKSTSISFNLSTSSSFISSYQNTIIYTQEYYFTGKTTSFTKNIPITLTLSSSDTASQYSLSTTAVITAPVEVYNKWINGGGLDSTDTENNDNTNNSTGTNDGTIAGSVVGAVVGVILCSIIIWLVIFKRKKYCKNWKNKLSLGNSQKSEGMVNSSVSSSQSFTHSRGYRVDYNSTNNVSSDPFKHEFEFDRRYNINRTPPVPAPRKNKNSNNKDFNNIGTLSVPLAPTNNDSDNYYLRFSYVSSDTDSSFNSSAVGSYSITSSSPDRYGTMSNNKQGFLREML